MGWYTGQRKMLFCMKAIMKESRNFELAHLKKKKMKEKLLGCVVTSWFHTFAMLICFTECIVGHETLNGEWQVVIKACKSTIFDIFENFYSGISHVHAIPEYRVNQL